MVAKIWKKILLLLLIIACLFNVVIKLVKKKSLDDELKASVQYMEMQEQKNQNSK